MAYFQDNGTVAASAITIASQQAGKPYVWGAAGPGAFDCSGLVHYAYSLAGLPGAGKATAHSWTTASIRFMGDAVTLGQEQPGDLIMPHSGHVGICIGNKQMWDAATTGVPVQVHKYSTVFAIRRISTPSNGVATGGATPILDLNNLNPIQPFIDMVNKISDTIHAFDKVFTVLSDGHMWVRIMEVVSGGTLLYLATKAG